MQRDIVQQLMRRLASVKAIEERLDRRTAMQLKLDGLDAHLKQAQVKGMAPLYVVHGDEHLLVLEAVDRLRRTAREAGFSEQDVLVAERGFHWSQLVGGPAVDVAVRRPQD